MSRAALDWLSSSTPFQAETNAAVPENLRADQEQNRLRTASEIREYANTRRECGHWEADMIVGGNRQHGLYVLVDRKSGLTHISFLENKTTAVTKQVMLRKLKAYPASLTQSITYDNENTGHEKLNEALGTTSFFCAQYHRWEKGSVEQVNG